MSPDPSPSDRPWIEICRREEFSAAHRIHNDELSEEENDRLFGPCHRTHGHNYELEVTVAGPLDPRTGMVMNLVDFGMDLEAAIAAPRVSFVEPDLLAVEKSLSEDVRGELEAMGHKLRIVDGLGNAHALLIRYGDDGRPVGFQGTADPRGEGEARGYDPAVKNAAMRR